MIHNVNIAKKEAESFFESLYQSRKQQKQQDVLSFRQREYDWYQPYHDNYNKIIQNELQFQVDNIQNNPYILSYRDIRYDEIKLSRDAIFQSQNQIRSFLNELSPNIYSNEIILENTINTLWNHNVDFYGLDNVVRRFILKDRIFKNNYQMIIYCIKNCTKANDNIIFFKKMYIRKINSLYKHDMNFYKVLIQFAVKKIPNIQNSWPELYEIHIQELLSED